jgi:acyl carrier protein
MEDFFRHLAEQLNEESVGPDDVLRDFQEWDSLTALSVVSMIDTNYKVVLSAEDLAGVTTAGALRDLVAARTTGGTER